jgi:P4 family phage/plasmid primase-like protien
MLLELLAKILGDYGMTFPHTLIEVAQGEQHPTELMDLKGCRLAVVSETQQGKQWNTNRLKHLAGGDTQKARRMRADYEAFASTHTLWIASNNRPTLNAPDPALWERYRELLFPTQWWAPGAKPEDRIGKFAEADLGLPTELESEEAAGILAWMVEGWVMYVANGGKLTYPDAVHRASSEAQAEATTFSVFVNEAFTKGADSDFVEVPAVFEAWKTYLKSESMFPAEKPTRSRDVGSFMMRERSYANFVPRKNGHDTAKVYGMQWTEAGRAWASLSDTTETVRSEDGKVIQVPFGTSGERNAK